MRNRVHTSTSLAVASVVGVLMLVTTTQAVPREENNVNGLLRNIYNDYMSADGSQTELEGDSLPALTLSDAFVWKDGKMLVKVIATSGEASAEELLKPAFEANDFEVTACSAHRCDGYLPIKSFPDFEARDEVRAIRPTAAVTKQAGSVVSEALKALRVDLVRQEDTNLTGAGLKIGILSDSFDNDGRLDDDLNSGDLPQNFRKGNILQDLPSGNGSDEGRAMAQLVHDLVPDAEIFFHTAFDGYFPTGIRVLANAGCNVIVDDVGILDEPFFQDGLIAQAANEVAEIDGIPYFTAVGNDGRLSWEGIFTGSGTFDASGCEIHEFGPGVTRQRVAIGPTLPNSTKVTSRIVFQWEDPFLTVSVASPGAARNMNIRVYDPVFGIIYANNDNDLGLDPVKMLFVPNGRTVELEFSLCTTGTPPPRMKWIGFDRVVDIATFDTQSPTSFGHTNQRLTAAVGASFYLQTPAFNQSPPLLEPFSSRGGTPILFEIDGSRKQADEIRNQPRFVAPDRCINTFFGLNTTYFPNGLGRYFVGTSAAAPNAAAVAILLLQVNPTLTPAQIYAILEETAIDMEGPGFDFDSGHGLIDALAAVNAAKALSMQPSTYPSIAPSTTPPSSFPSSAPSDRPSNDSSTSPSTAPSEQPSNESAAPSNNPSETPSLNPTSFPTVTPTDRPMLPNVTLPTVAPSVEPSIAPSSKPSNSPSSIVPPNPKNPTPTPRPWRWASVTARPRQPSPSNWWPSNSPGPGRKPTKSNRWWLRPSNRGKGKKRRKGKKLNRRKGGKGSSWWRGWH